MTKLEQEIFKAMYGDDPVEPSAIDVINNLREHKRLNAKAAAEVAKKYIEKALIDGCKTGWDMEAGDYPTVVGDSYFSSDVDRFSEKWLKENGIT